MPAWTPEDLRRQLHSAKGLTLAGRSLYEILHEQARAHGLSFALVLAVASRETGIRNIAGDGGHGHGPLQLDDRSHVISANWREDPSAIVAQCCTLLHLLMAWSAQKYPTLSPPDQTKVALAAYNAGEGAAVRGHVAGNADLRTSGGDYGADCLRRMTGFAELLSGV